VVNLWAVKGFNSLITCVTLPEATVITYGNRTETYRQYKLGRGRDRPQRPKAAMLQVTGDKQVRPTALLPSAWHGRPRC
jgi:hypothetical protein